MSNLDGIAEKVRDVPINGSEKKVREICYYLICSRNIIDARQRYDYPSCGDCRICKFDPENNPKCAAYSPTKFIA